MVYSKKKKKIPIVIHGMHMIFYFFASHIDKKNFV